MSENKQETRILSADDIKRTLYRLAHEVRENNSRIQDIVVVGVQTRGVYIAQRVRKILQELEGVNIPFGRLDITFYRDDLTTIGPKPLVKETDIPVDLTDKVVVLVDDVLFTGRTVRAALNEIMDFGRPEKVELLVLVDRGHRELPIRADFVGKNLPTSREERVEVLLEETDGRDEVRVIKK